MIKEPVGRFIANTMLKPLEQPTHRFEGYNWFGDRPRDMLDWFDRYMAKQTHEGEVA